MNYGVKKNGKRNNIQTYKCTSCGYKFQNKKRPTVVHRTIMHDYIWRRQTLSNVAQYYKRSIRWVQKIVDQTSTRVEEKIIKKESVVIADTTFFSRTSGIIVFRDPHTKKNLWWQETTTETMALYYRGKEELAQRGVTITAIVLDGRRGIREVFAGIPIQMCHFHQKQIIKRYLTSKPNLEAGKELKSIVDTLVKTNQEKFEITLSEWYKKWEQFLKEKTFDHHKITWCYTHKKIRAAFRSLKTNLPFLFTHQKYPELKIPNTTNSLDGYFNRLKGLLNVHRGMMSTKRMRIADEILRGEK